MIFLVEGFNDYRGHVRLRKGFCAGFRYIIRFKSYGQPVGIDSFSNFGYQTTAAGYRQLPIPYQ